MFVYIKFNSSKCTLRNFMIKTPRNSPKKDVSSKFQAINMPPLASSSLSSSAISTPKQSNRNSRNISVTTSQRSSRKMSSESSTITQHSSKNSTPPHKKSESLLFVEKKQLNILRSHLKKILDIITQVSQFNHATIIEDTQVVKESSDMLNLYQPFQDEAMKYIAKIEELEKQGKPLHLAPISTMKSVSFTFFQRWKELVSIFDLLRKEGMKSLGQLVNVKIKSIEIVINEITSKQRRNTVHAEDLMKAGGTLNAVVSSLNDTFIILFNQTELENLIPESLQGYINNVRSLLSIYNECHFRDFPKSGYLQVELSHFKSIVIASCNDIIGALRAAFTLESDLDRIMTEGNEVTDYLQDLTQRLNLPSTVVKTIPKAKLRNQDNSSSVGENTMERITEFIEKGSTVNPEKSVVVCAKIDTFIDEVSEDLDIEIDTEMSTWDRLDTLKEAFFSRLAVSKEFERDLSLYQNQLKSQGEEMSEMLKDSYQKGLDFKAIKQEMQCKINELKVRLDQMTKERDDALATVARREESLKKLRTDKDNEHANEMMARIGNRMNEIMSFDVTKDNKEIKNVQNMGVFVLERRCQKCREYELMRKQIRDALKGVIDLNSGETIVEQVQRLSNEITHLREYNSQLVEENKQALFDMTALRHCAIDMLNQVADDMKKMRPSVDDVSAKDVAEMTKLAFEQLRNHHQEQMELQKKRLLEERAADFREISFKMNEMCQDSECEATPDFKTLVLNKVEKTKERLFNAERDLRFANGILKDVEKWMNKQTELSTEQMPIDQALYLMMQEMENGNTPLHRQIEKMTSDEQMSRACLYIISKRINEIVGSGILKTENMDIVELSGYMELQSEKMLNLHNKNMERLKKQDEDIEYSTANLKNVCNKMAYVLQIDEMDFSKKLIRELVDHLVGFMDEMTGSSSKYFVPISTLNDMTKQIRKNAKLPSCLNPFLYIPMLDKQLSIYRKSLDAIELFVYPLKSIFSNFDFKLESFDPLSPSFKYLREQIFRMHGIIGRIPDSDILKVVNDVLHHFLSLSSSFLSCFASLSFETIGKQEKEAIFKFQVNGK